MLIKDIKFRRVRKIARKRSDPWSFGFSDSGALANAFDWHITDEKRDFWSCINREDYEEAYKQRPDLFRPTKKEIEEAYKINRLLGKR